MKRTRFVLLLSLILCLSCNKDELNMEQDTMSFLSSQVNRTAIQKALSDHAIANKGDRFIMPFFSNDGFGVFNFETAEIAFFSTDLDSRDFYRENHDGTVSVHINSNTAVAEYANFITGDFLLGDRAHFTANYNGPVVEIPIFDEFGNFLFTFKFVDLAGFTRAISIHGNGKVYNPITGDGYKLKMKVLENRAESMVYFALEQ